jgi:GT2 family glycosyltransferase
LTEQPYSSHRPVGPLVSIIIPYYRRGSVFEECLDSVLGQRYSCREIIVVDNHSDDGLRGRLGNRLSEVTLLELPVNQGACAARNAGISAARGDLFIFIDDDVSFASPAVLDDVVETFAAHQETAVLALQVCDPHSGKVRLREWCHTRPYDRFAHEEFETNWFGEGACALRRSVFESCGVYYEPFFYGAEGHDLIVRVLDHGFRILHTPHIRVYHWAPEGGRMLDRQYYYFTRNYLWMAYKDYSTWDGLVFFIPKLLMMLYFSWRSSIYRPLLRGLWDGIRGLSRIRPHRTPISRDTVRYLRDFDKWRPGLVARLSRHRAQPQI